MDAFEKLSLPDVAKIIVVASGKGGVGKSTVSANLAVALARQGYKVALVDADIYGPSIPRMFGIENEKPLANEIDGKQIILPIEKHGVKIMSIGFFIENSQGLIWRGPMVANAFTQLLEFSQWGKIDFMIIDFPPGTGDIQLTAVQKLNIHGAVLVTTPQEIALNDARKAASMFQNPDLNIPVLGVIENMSWFTPANHPDEKYFIFGSGGGQRLAEECHVKLLGQIPLVAEVGVAAEKGQCVFQQTDKSIIESFERIATELV
ncbi:MAG: hypothetical protein A2W93_04305 [Bacteroidetes bacterium GWF2_43_63]|nr:MAG: hypothetical protein A2W94_12295 [Bacteroidetes bacterium GWE2_42_42]OFY55988.1 MAG: hypothetical protein A2W93_04305 [Bacteroidetes bacterium GWF2_43_63]HBG70773.1 hypothetical protein [Bacteroidales bacterium]HCB62399.1 hypothetical protein [Bacteroidales bacterium]HCY21854.1 hypothetical protein [Bacteroidales bacterium]